MNASFRIFLLFFCVSAAAFAPALRNGYVIDDGNAVSENTDLDRRPLTWLLSKDYFEFSRELSFRPVVTLSHLWDRKWGATAGHALNIFLHAFVGMSLFAIGKMFLPVSSAVFGTLIFLVHPAYCETVYVITFREDLLCALFLLWTLWGVLNAKPFLTGLSFAAALFSKETAVMAPLFGLLMFWTMQNTARRPLIGLFLIAGVYAVVRFFILPGPGLTAVRDSPIFLEQGALFTRYIATLLFPRTLSIDHQWPSAPAASEVWPGGVVALIFFFFTARRAHENNIAALPGLWFFVFLFPVMNIVPIFHMSADRYLYIPMLLPSLWIAHAGLSAVKKPRVMAGFIWVLLLFLGARTFYRGLDFRDARGLYLKETAANPKSAMAAWMLGQMEMASGNHAAARGWFDKVLELKPFFHHAYIDLGKIELAEGKKKEAARWFEAAYAAAPADPEAILSLAEFKRLEGDTLQSEALYRRALLFPPDPTVTSQRFLNFYREVRRNYR